IVCGGQPHHRQPMGGGRDAPPFMRRIGGRNEQDLVEPELLACFLGAAQMGDVDRIEGAAEYPDAPPEAAGRRAHERICPLPWITYLYVVSSRSPIGPRACRRLVEMPTSAPNPNS